MPNRPARPLISLVIPVFNEEQVLPELVTRLSRLFADQDSIDWHVVLVDDGSRDRSGELVRAVAAQDARFELLELSRNFGFQAAIAAGLLHARGDAVVTLDADLQDPPELIPKFVGCWQDGADVVRAVRRSRRETGVRRFGMNVFHTLFSRIADFPIEGNVGTFGLLDRTAVEAINRLPERNRYFPGLRSWIGFRTCEVFYDRDERAAGEPSQSLARLTRYALDALFSFSHLPLRLVTYTGVMIGIAGFILGLYYVTKRLLGIEHAPTGFTTLVALALFLGGVQLIGIGVLGEYLARIYDEVKQRPLFIVKGKPVDPAG